MQSIAAANALFSGAILDPPSSYVVTQDIFLTLNRIIESLLLYVYSVNLVQLLFNFCLSMKTCSIFRLKMDTVRVMSFFSLLK